METSVDLVEVGMLHKELSADTHDELVYVVYTSFVYLFQSEEEPCFAVTSHIDTSVGAFAE